VSTISEILNKAADRGREMNLLMRCIASAGGLELMQKAPGAKLETAYPSRVDYSSGFGSVQIEWQTYPDRNQPGIPQRAPVTAIRKRS